MLIGIDASRANKEKRTGTEWYAYYIIENLKKIDNKNQYFLYANKNLMGKLAVLPNNFKQKLLFWPIKYIWTHVRLSWEMVINAPDILFVPAHSVPLIHRNRTIVTIHDLGFLHNSEIYHPLARAYHRFSAWWSVKKALKIITISEFTKQDIIKKYKINNNKIIVIPLGIDHSKYKIIVDAEVEKVKIKHGLKRKYFFYLGRLEKKKNIKFLIQAFNEFQQHHQKYQLVLGGHYSFGGEEIKALVKKIENVKVLGYLDDIDIAPLMAGAKSFIFPSLFEGFGLPILEAMACGCAVISSNATSLPEVGSDAAYYFNPKNKQELVKLMNKMAMDNEARAELIKKGYKRSKMFNWEKTTQEILRELIE